jgi:hypothetical protein
MELSLFRKDKPGCTYYFSPLSVYNLGVVNHAHIYDDGHISEHLHAHVYHEGVGKKGMNNVASLIIKTLQKLNIFHKDSVGGELNIIFDNCSGQNKNNTVLRLAAWLTAMNYFKEVNFIFLVVGHTQNAADRLFACLKTEYHKQNIFTFQDFLETLTRSDMVMVHPETPEDFLNYDKLLSTLFWTLVGNIQKNHIFSCNDDGSQMKIWQSNLPEHEKFVLYLWKRGTWEGMTHNKIVEFSKSVLMPITWAGMNPYKVIEMFKKYKPNIPLEYHSDELYAKPSDEVWVKV